MKKAIVTLTCLVVLLSLMLSCSSYEPEGRRYQIEKTLFEAEKLNQTYAVKPELRTAQDYHNLVAGYRKVYDDYRRLFPDLAGKDSLTETEKEATFLAGKALMTAATMLMSGDQLDSAAAIFDLVLGTNYFAPRHRNEALLSSGKIAERQGRWIDAEKNYLKLLQLYYPPVVNRVLPAVDVVELPRTIVEHYQAVGDSATAMQKIEWAIHYYQGIVDSFPHYPVALASIRLLAELYNAKGEYQRSVNLLQTVVDSTGNVVDAAKGMIADLYVTHLNREGEAVRMYQELIDRGIDTFVVATSYVKLATIEFKNKQFSEGRKYLEKMTSHFSRYPELTIKVQLMKAQSFEAEKEYDRAAQEYLALINQYPASSQAIETLVYFPEFYKRMGENDLAREWVTRSMERLKETAKANANKRLGLMASTYLGTFYIRNKMFNEAISQFQELRQRYPKSSQAADALLKIGLIYQLDFKDKVKALEAYREFLKQYPNSPVKQKIEEEVMRLEKS